MESSGGLSPGAKVSSPLRAEVLVTAAQILDLSSNPVEIIPSPGPGKAIVTMGSGFLIQENGTVPYASGGDSALYFGRGDYGVGTADFWSDGYSDNGLWTADLNSFSVTFFWNIENLPIVLKNRGDDLVDGDGDLRVVIDYFVYTLPG